MNYAGITTAHVTGFVVGVGVSATAYYGYMKNKDKVDNFLANHGIDMPKSEVEDFGSMTLEELMLKKEHIEDLIAEKEMDLDNAEVVSE